MSIVNSEIIRDETNGGRRMIWYRFVDSENAEHHYGPVITTESAFDTAAHMAIVAAKLADRLAAEEFEGIVE